LCNAKGKNALICHIYTANIPHLFLLFPWLI